jgi:6-phosphogluconolactonase
MTTSNKQLIYIGTSTEIQPEGAHRPEGIFVYELDAAAGKMTFLEAVAGVKNPAFLTISPDRRFLFAVCEIFGGEPSSVNAYAVDPATGGLALLNRQPIYDAAPCYISLDRAGKWALVANYTGGSTLVYPIRDDGQLGEAATKIQHTGVGVHPERQEAPHVHCVVLDPSERYALVVDLGLDRVFSYAFDHTAGKLSLHNSAAIMTAPGAGPRHVTFHPKRRLLYVINELASTLSTYAFDAEHATFSHTQTVSTLPDGFTRINYPAQLQVASSGRFLYASNRGHDSIAVYAIDPPSGHLSPIEFVSAGGQWPRHFTLDTTGGYLLVGNEHSGTVVVFRVDPASGRLTPTGEVIAVPAPMVIGVMNRG